MECNFTEMKGGKIFKQWSELAEKDRILCMCVDGWWGAFTVNVINHLCLPIISY